MNTKHKKPQKNRVKTISAKRRRKDGSAVLRESLANYDIGNRLSQRAGPWRFIDLFAGIGGTRLGFERAGGRCVFTSEWDKYAQQTYLANFGTVPHGDIRQIPAADIPDFDILLAGFPCQPFSIAGVSKKISLGRKHGFEDEKQGNLFFEIARILKDKRPVAFMLENVKNLKSHDKGKTFQVIINTLDDLGYNVVHQVIDAGNFVPQHRERTYIVGFRKELVFRSDFQFPFIEKKNVSVSGILENRPESKYTLTDNLWRYLQAYAEKHRANGNGFGFGLVDPAFDKTTRTLSARYYKDGSEILIKQKGVNPRRLTPRECARLMGFPDTYKIVVSDTQAYKQFGNSIVVPVVEVVAKAIFRYLNEHGYSDQAAKKPQYVGDKIKSQHND